MATVSPTEFHKGMVIVLDGTPHLILDLWTSGTAQTKHKTHVRLRNLQTGRIAERAFQDHERYETVELHKRPVQFSYRQDDRIVFTDLDTYEEYEMSEADLGDRIWFLKEDLEYKALILDGRLLDIEIPPAVVLEVKETAPPITGGSDATWKPAVLETGLEIMVPLFIATGDHVRVDTAKKQYLSKEEKKSG